MKDPAYTMPRALVLGLLIVTVVYVVVTLALMYVVPMDQAGSPEAFVAQVGSVLLGRTGARALSLVIIVCVPSSLAAIMMLAPRVYFAMPRDGVFPAAASASRPGSTTGCGRLVSTIAASFRSR